MSYKNAGLLTGESYSGGILDGLGVANRYDADLRRATNGVTSGGSYLTWSMNTYDAASRLLAVGDGAVNANYSYLANPPLAEQITFKQSVTTRMTTTRQYDSLNRLTNQTSAPTGMDAGSYDQQGNLVSDGRWTNRWDGENRLISMESLGSAPAGSKRRLTFDYDWQGRRIVKAACVWTNESWSVVLSNKFLYDGWNLVAELNATNNALIRSYLWGLDLSGQAGPALNSAGGVGGLVAVTPASVAAAFPAYDGNGNVMGLSDSATTNWVARYEYGPFGEAIRATGLLAEGNPLRFSTKYQDDESGLLYYGYRYLHTTTGRWWSRDLIEEKGGKNLYGFVHNAPLVSTDVLGLSVACGCSLAEARDLAASLSQRYLPAAQGPGGKEAIGKICCNRCKHMVYFGTIAYAPNGSPYNPRPGDSQCRDGDFAIAIWHTHPSNEPLQYPKDGRVSPDYIFVRAFGNSGAACEGFLSYMRYTANGFTALDPGGVETPIRP